MFFHDIGSVVRTRQGVRARVLGRGIINQFAPEDNVPADDYDVYEIEVIVDHIGRGDVVTLSGTKMLKYGVDLFADADEWLASVTYRFTSKVKAATESAAEHKLREALIEALTFDDDDEAAEPLVELEMQAV